MIEKTQTIRVSGDIHKMAKSKAAECGEYLQIWIENLIRKECKKENV